MIFLTTHSGTKYFEGVYSALDFVCDVLCVMCEYHLVVLSESEDFCVFGCLKGSVLKLDVGLEIELMRIKCKGYC